MTDSPVSRGSAGSAAEEGGWTLLDEQSDIDAFITPSLIDGMPKLSPPSTAISVDEERDPSSSTPQLPPEPEPEAEAEQPSAAPPRNDLAVPSPPAYSPPQDRQVILLDSDSFDRAADASAKTARPPTVPSCDEHKQRDTALVELHNDNMQLRQALGSSQDEVARLRQEVAQSTKHAAALEEELKLLRTKCELSEHQMQATRGEADFLRAEAQRLKEHNSQSEGRASSELLTLKGQLQAKLVVEQAQVQQLESAVAAAALARDHILPNGTSSTEADLLNLSAAEGNSLTRAATLLGQLSQLPLELKTRLEAVEEREKRKISLQGFHVGELAVFFPIPRLHNHFIAFNVGCPNHFLADESKEIIGDAKHFTKDYVLGHIVEKEQHVSDGTSYIAAGVTFYTLKVMAIESIFDP